MVTVGKATQTAAVLFRDGYDADKAMLSETNPGGAEEQLRRGIDTLNTLADEGYWGSNGKIMQLESALRIHFFRLKEHYPHVSYTVLGNMAAIRLPCFTKKETAQTFVDRLLEEQILTTTCGRDDQSFKVRMYIPLIIHPMQLRLAFAHIEKAVRSFGKNRKGGRFIE